MTKKAVATSNYIDGNSERVKITSPVTGRVWVGTVMRWLLGAPEVLTDEGEKRWFPKDWPREESK